MTVSQQGAIARLVQKDLLCAACFEVRNSPEFNAKLETLNRRLYCEGCETEHPRFFFYPEIICRFDQGLGRLICVGYFGRLPLCSHRTPSTTATWQGVRDENTSLHDLVCTHPSHCPVSAQMKRSEPSPYPRMTLTNNLVVYGWDLPLLDLDQQCQPSLKAISDTLGKLLARGSNNRQGETTL